MFGQYLAVALLGMLFASAELLSRYKDDPLALLEMGESYFYLIVNALIGIAALYLLQVFPVGAPDLKLQEAHAAIVAAGSDADAALKVAKGAGYDTVAALLLAAGNESSRMAIYNVLIAGFGGAAFFRSSIARTKVGSAEIGVGPAFVIDTLLSTVDRAIDRRRAHHRAKTIPALMREIPPGFAALSLKEFCIGAMQNFSADDEKTLETQIAAIMKATIPEPTVKSALFGMVLTEHFGEKVLRMAIEQLDGEIKAARKAVEEKQSRPVLGLSSLESLIAGGSADDTLADDEPQDGADGSVPGEDPSGEGGPAADAPADENASSASREPDAAADDEAAAKPRHGRS